MENEMRKNFMLHDSQSTGKLYNTKTAVVLGLCLTHTQAHILKRDILPVTDIESLKLSRGT